MDVRERLVDVDPVADGDCPGGDRRGALPAGAAMHVGAAVLVQPAGQDADCGFDLVRREGRRSR